LTVFWVTVLGIFDELYQYTILTPFFKYFDFNDMILNLLGAGLGVVLIFISAQVAVRQRAWYGLSSLWAWGIFLAMAIILSWAGVFALYPSEAGLTNVPLIILNRAAPAGSFWTEAYQGRFFHIIRPGEGILMMTILFIFYQFLDNYSRFFRK
jgi:hypothetical protein